MSKPILMSAENPQGEKLEELLAKIFAEISVKNTKIFADESPVAKVVRDNNCQIMYMLKEAEILQRKSLAALAELRPDPGPLGAPRIGRGSTGKID